MKNQKLKLKWRDKGIKVGDIRVDKRIKEKKKEEETLRRKGKALKRNERESHFGE